MVSTGDVTEYRACTALLIQRFKKDLQKTTAEAEVIPFPVMAPFAPVAIAA